MAETAVGLVIDRLIPLLGEEAYLLRGVHREVEGIKCDLDFLMAFLHDADTRAETANETNANHGVKIWVEKLRKSAFELEDVIDQYTYLMAQHHRTHRVRFIGFLRRNAYLVVKLKSRLHIASKIQEIKRKIGDINKKSQGYRFDPLLAGQVSGANWDDPRNDACFLEEAEVVGIESDRDELIERLESEAPRRSVISILGMGGLGKTTLAHQVYARVSENFECRAWIEVSQSYKKVDLLRSLLKKICLAKEEFVPVGVETMDEQTLTIELKTHLQGRRYLVVFDDVWNVNFWADIKNALPEDDKKCGRILITTRYVEVAIFCRTSISCVHIHHLKPLPPKKAWQLFCQKAFHSEPEKSCPIELNDLSWKISKKCHGLPLAIVVIAGLLSTKSKNVDQWRKLHDSLSSELENNEHLTSITRILCLSYNDMPYYLKSCFLYFGIFPEDCSIRHGRLIRQWIAEGFVKPKKDKSLETVAEEYLVELINRSLVQVSKIRLDGKAKSCRVHDLLREIILKKVEDTGFCQVLSQNHSDFKSLSRRVSVFHGSYSIFQRNNLKIPHVRSLYFFDQGKVLNAVVSTVTKSFKLLKVLDFENARRLGRLPKHIGSLFHLRYLSVRRTRVDLLPKSIGELENLETLDLKRSRVSTLPVEISRLNKLRHLIASNIDYKMDSLFSVYRGVRLENGIVLPKTMQKLYFVEANVVGVDVFEVLNKLTQLRKLGIKMLRSQDAKKLCKCVQKMEHLESLSVASENEHDTFDFAAMSSAPEFLRHLSLDGQLKTLPDFIPRLHNLVRLRLGWSKLKDDPLKELQHLRNLLELGIYYEAYSGTKLEFDRGAFPKLKVLCLGDLSELDLVVIKEEALPDLERFLIGSCQLLSQVPIGVQHLKSLKVLGFIEMPMEFLMFQDFQSLRNVANVRFAHRTDGEYTAFGLDSVVMIQEIMRDHKEIEWESSHFEELLKHNGAEWDPSHFEELFSNFSSNHNTESK